MGRLDLLRTAKQNGVPLMAKPPFSVAVIDPPWPYCATSKGKDKPKTAGAAKLSGYSDSIYRTHSMPIGELAALRISELVSDHIFLWTTAPFMEDAYKLIHAWGFEPVSIIPWIKCTKFKPGVAAAFDEIDAPLRRGDDAPINPVYGVGFWFRGCVEYVIVAKKHGAKSVRTSWIGLLSENAKHTRKPRTVYEFIEAGGAKKVDGTVHRFDPPFVTVFGRKYKPRPGWTVLGDEVDGKEIQEAIAIQLADLRSLADLKAAYPPKKVSHGESAEYDAKFAEDAAANREARLNSETGSGMGLKDD